jgi:predicted NAD/FAD-binding protein
MENPVAGTTAQSRVAIVGTGLAGLTTAYLLHRDQQRRYAITLFEQVRRASQK